MQRLASKVCFGFLFALFLTACSEEEDMGDYIKTFKESNVDMASFASKYLEVCYEELVEAADSIDCYAGMSTAIFGGSIASNAESDVCKSLYHQLLRCSPIVTYGRGGLGYATENGSVQDFLPLLERHDIYILWCSTNDYGTGVPAGSATDYTEADGYDESHTNTQCGGINKCIHSMREKNPNALIVGFTSLRFFGENASRKDGYIEDYSARDYWQGMNFREYVDKQRETFELAGIPYFDQYYCGLFDADNYSDYYFTDGYHLNEDGYFLLGCEQIRYFIDLAKRRL